MGASEMSFVRLSAAALVAMATAACSGNPETGTGPRENTGTLIGAVAGGLIGSQFGGGTGERVAAGLAGAAVGGLLGNRIGSAMDDDDKQRAYAAQMQALERKIGHGGRVEEPGLGPVWIGGSRSRLPDQRTAVPAIHPHDLYRRQAAGRARQRPSQPGRHVDRGRLTARTG